MQDDQRHWTIKSILFEYVKSPSLKHIRDPRSLEKLARDIIKAIDQGNSIWGKWDEQREIVARSAVGCWVPTEDLRAFLNQMRGAALSDTDVDQRLKALEAEYYALSVEEMRAGCLALYESEKEKGTEMPAILGLLREHTLREEERLRIEQQGRHSEKREQDRLAQEQRLLSGADCRWTQYQKLNWFCRTNGRTYRLSPTKDKMWHLHRVKTVSSNEAGMLMGIYRARGEASKAVAVMAYQPEPRI